MFSSYRPVNTVCPCCKYQSVDFMEENDCCSFRDSYRRH